MKKYSVFISSTMDDLREERVIVKNALLRADCFPVGMEYFPAADIKQEDYIRPLIDEADYFILILGGKYGSLVPDSNKSYTQMEYEYAKEKGIPIIAYVKLDKENTPIVLDEDEQKRIHYSDFLQDVQKDRLRQGFRIREELAGLIIQSINTEKQLNPRAGWRRTYENPFYNNECAPLHGKLQYTRLIHDEIRKENNVEEVKLIDGSEVKLYLGQGSQGVFNIVVSVNDHATNMFYDIPYDYFEDDELRDNCVIQVAYAQLGNLDDKLLFLCTGEPGVDITTVVYKINMDGITKIGAINGQQRMIVDYSIKSLYGGQGLYDEYGYYNGELFRLETIDENLIN